MAASKKNSRKKLPGNPAPASPPPLSEEPYLELQQHLFGIASPPREPGPPPRSPALPPALTPVQSRTHFTRLKQIDALTTLAADQANDIGFMARLLTLCSLPRTNPGTRLQYKRHNGPFKLIMIAGGDNKLPYGNLPRLLLAWICTEAVRTQQRDLTLGRSLSEFMRQLGITSTSGGNRGDRTRLKNQIDRLFHCHVELIYETEMRKRTATSRVADSTDLWWDYRQPTQDTLWKSQIRLGEAFFNEVISNPVPLDMEILRHMRRSSLGLDLYMWLSYKTFTLYTQGKPPERLSWEHLYRQFGADPERAEDKYVLRDFRKDLIRELGKLKTCWPSLDVSTPRGCLEIRACPPSVNPNAHLLA